MIQRIQTLYLLVAFILTVVLIFVPFADLAGLNGVNYIFDISGISMNSGTVKTILSNTWPIIIMISITLPLLIITIFQFKNRKMQIRLSYLSIFSLFVIKALMYYYTWGSSHLDGGSLHASIFAEFPTIAAILVFLAIRGIRKDENLVKSIDRIR
jgi:hypothetical protein